VSSKPLRTCRATLADIAKGIRDPEKMKTAAERLDRIACTHATLTRLTGEELPEDLSGKALFGEL